MKKEKERRQNNTDKDIENTDRQIKISDSVSRRKSFGKGIHYRLSRKLNKKL
jgi:hypothetical protein